MKNRLQKALSLLLTIMMVFSVCIVAETSVLAQSTTYYVKNGGSDLNQGTSAAPFKTISKAIDTAIKAGFKEGDTVTVKVLEFPNVEWGTEMSYDFDLVVDSGTSSRCNVSIPSGTVLCGDVSFINTVVKCTTLYFGYNDVYFASNSILEGTNYYFGKPESNETINESQNVTFDTTLVGKNIYIADKNSTATYKNDLTLVINNKNSRPEITLSSKESETNIEGNFNLYFQSSYSAKFIKGAGKIKANGAIQLITKPTTNFVDSTDSVLKGMNAKDGFYLVVNSSGVDDFYTFTETAGKYGVNSDRYDITATAKDDSKILAKDGYLVLPKAGEYEVNVIKDVENVTYYVSSSGKSTNNGTKFSPFLTVGDAVLAAKKAGYWGKDTVTVRILSATAAWGVNYDSTADSGNNAKENVRKNQKYGYEFLLVVQSDSSATKSTLNIPKGTPMLGDVKFDNINIPTIEKLAAYDECVTFTNSVNFKPQYIALGYASKQNSVGKKIDLVLKNQFNGYIELTNGTYAGKKYNQDVTVTVDNPNTNVSFSFVLYWGGTTTFNGNLNINVVNAKSVDFGAVSRPKIDDRNAGNCIINKAAHIIVNSKTEMDSESIANLQSLAEVGKVYHISNDSGIGDLLEFTEDEGKFKVKSNYVAVAVDTNGKITVSKNGYLMLKTPGEYAVSAQAETSGVKACASGSHKYTDSCDGMCNVCGATRSIKHTYKYYCSRACTFCGIKRKAYHSIAWKTIPATDKKDGENQDICDVCFIVLARYPIAKIKTFELSEKSFTYDGTVKTPKVIMYDTEDVKLVEKVDYTLTYPKGMTKVGTYEIKIKFKGEFKGTKYMSYKINPPKSSVEKLTPSNNSIKVEVKKKSSQVDGYQIEYSTSKKFTKSATKTKTIKGYKNTTTTLKSLKAGKKYYVRVRTYKTVGGKKYYSSWSKVSSKTIKKISLSKTSVKKVSSQKKSLKVTVAKNKKVSGYQIEYSTSKKFSASKTKTVKGYKNVSATIKSLKSKKTYYIRVRSYKTVDGGKYYSSWSKSVKKKTK